jgi:hypothetical protein
VFLGNDGLAFIIQDTRWTRRPAHPQHRSRLPGVLPATVPHTRWGRMAQNSPRSPT